MCVCLLFQVGGVVVGQTDTDGLSPHGVPEMELAQQPPAYPYPSEPDSNPYTRWLHTQEGYTHAGKKHIEYIHWLPYISLPTFCSCRVYGLFFPGAWLSSGTGQPFVNRTCKLVDILYTL